MLQGENDFGHSLSEPEIKKGLKELNSEIQFDIAGRHGWYTIGTDANQGVFHRTRHLASMSRGMIPEYDVWAVVKNADGTKRKSHIVQIGWRNTFQRIAAKQVPGVNWDSLCVKFGVERKYYIGGEEPELEEAI